MTQKNKSQPQLSCSWQKCAFVRPVTVERHYVFVHSRGLYGGELILLIERVTFRSMLLPMIDSIFERISTLRQNKLQFLSLQFV